jgi:diacylglycerol kinase (ATP)
MPTDSSNQPLPRIKLLFNPASGATNESPSQLLNILRQLQNLAFVPEVFIIENGSDLDLVIGEAIARGIRIFVVSGGDGTIESVAAKLVGTQTSLGILPTGTRNNIALSLGIPDDLSAAIDIIRHGKNLNIDVGLAVCGDQEQIFLETCSIGLLSALYPAADEIQHGNLGPVGDFLATLATSPASKMHLTLDNDQELATQGHVILAANMPYVGPHFHLAPEDSYLDGVLDLVIFSDLSKLELISNVIQMADGESIDPRIQRFQVVQVEIHTDPAMPVQADGVQIGEGSVSISIRPKALTVIIPQKSKPRANSKSAAAHFLTQSQPIDQK